MAKRINRGLKLIGVPVEPQMHDQIEDLAAELGLAEDDGSAGGDKPLPLAEVCRRLMADALAGGAGKRIAEDLADAGYQAGLRRGLHEVREYMKKLYGK